MVRERSAFCSRLSAGTVFILIFLLCALSGAAFSQRLQAAAPASVGMNTAKLEQIEQLVNADIADKKLPGAVVIVGHKGRIVYRKAFGNRSLMPKVEPMTVDTIFDVASLTKPIATATSIMILVERGKLRLSDPIGKFIPEIEDEQAKRATIQHLLTHTAGYRPDFDLSEKWTGRKGMLAALKKEKLQGIPGTRFVYSDIGFIVLAEIIQRITGKGVNLFFDEEVVQKLFTDGTAKMRPSIFFIPWEYAMFDLPGADVSEYGDVSKSVANFRVHSAKIAPTEGLKSQQSYLGSKFGGSDAEGSQILRGQVHDPTSFRMGGVAGHAGLFATADDLAVYCQMILNGGVSPSLSVRNRILSTQTVARMTAPNVVSDDGAARGLGWDINSAFSSNRGELFPLGSFGHTGFTGTSIWIDPTSQTFVVFMSNRVHPDGKGDVTPLRARVATVAASAIEDTPIEKWRESEARYNAAVAAQIPKFREAAQRLAAGGQQTSTRKPAVNAEVLNGIDILEKNGFKELNGLKIGLVTNQTGRNLAGKLTIDILHEAKNIHLAALFSPEHGIRGQADENVSDSVDEKTGLPIYSLYGETRRPKPEQLIGIDAIVYDIQDVGTRFYTYTATLRNIMEEAAKAGIPVYILDRPNPLNGEDIEGPIADEDKLSFTAAHTIPVRYGMTIGELGLMMNTERKIGAKVQVIKMEGWRRSMWFDETGQTWVNPSPNMRSLTEAALYPGIGLLETTNLSVGRGTDTPFEVIGAPWIDGGKLAMHLNMAGLPGIRFVPIRFKPKASVFKDNELGGINLIITDRKSFRPLETGIAVAAAIRDLFPGEWQINSYGRLLVNADTFAKMARGETPAAIADQWKNDKDTFFRRRAQFLLYK